MYVLLIVIYIGVTMSYGGKTVVRRACENIIRRILGIERQDVRRGWRGLLSEDLRKVFFTAYY